MWSHFGGAVKDPGSRTVLFGTTSCGLGSDLTLPSSPRWRNPPTVTQHWKHVADVTESWIFFFMSSALKLGNPMWLLATLLDSPAQESVHSKSPDATTPKWGLRKLAEPPFLHR